jgi:hypothetical protein
MKDSGDGTSLTRLLNYEATEKDKKKATQAMIHYHTWHRSQLVSSLSWSQWWYYWTWYKAERTLAVMGLFGSGEQLLDLLKVCTYITEQHNKP